MYIFLTGIGLQHGYYNGPADCMGAVYRKQGLSGVYRGVTVMAMRDMPALVTYIVSYEFLNTKFRANKKLISKKLDCMYCLTAGGLAGVASWVLTMPMDTIKSKVQAQAASEGTVNLRQIVKETYHTNGVKGFFRGSGVAIIRAFPVNGVTFMVWSQVLDYLNQRNVMMNQNML